MSNENGARIYPMVVLDRHYDESSVSTEETEMDDEVYNRFLDAEEDDKVQNGYYDISSHAFPGRFDYEDKTINKHSVVVPNNIPKDLFKGDEEIDRLFVRKLSHNREFSHKQLAYLSYLEIFGNS